jgi:hypothetical protein
MPTYSDSCNRLPVPFRRPMRGLVMAAKGVRDLTPGVSSNIRRKAQVAGDVVIAK